MKKIKILTVEVKYKVTINDVDVTDSVYEHLMESSENYERIEGTSSEYGEAPAWLADNIKEGDCTDIEYEINEISLTYAPE